MKNHQIFNIVNEACDEDTEMKQFVTVSAHVKSTRLTSLWDSSHIQAAAGAVDEAPKRILLPSSRHHGLRVSEKLEVDQGGSNCHS